MFAAEDIADVVGARDVAGTLGTTGGGTKPLSRQWRLWLPSALIQTSGFSDRAFRLDD
jgi:hypothetical protein